MEYNKSILNKVCKDLYRIWLLQKSNMCKDDDWHNVYELANAFKMQADVRDITLSAGVYHNYFDFDHDKLPYRDYNVIINTEFGNITGYIRCCSAGTLDNPFSMYDIVISLYPAEINEAYNDNNTSSKSFINDLKNAHSFDDIKNTLKKHIRMGVLTGMALSTIFLSFNLTADQKLQLEYTAYETTFADSINVYSEEDFEPEYVKPEPEWQLLCNDVITTVYHAVPAQCNNDVAHTASMFKLNLLNPEAHKIIAMERTMMTLYGLKYGDLVQVKGTDIYDGVYQIQDTMNKKYAGQHKIDILINKKSKQGKWDNISIYKLNNPEECYYDVKSDSNMLNALNQKSIDLRLGYELES